MHDGLVRRVWPIVAALLCAGLAHPAAAGADHPRKRGALKLHRQALDTHGDPRGAFRGRARTTARISAVGPLAATWCGNETFADTANPFTNAPQVKVLYAFPSDLAGGSKLKTQNRDELIQDDVEAIRNRLDSVSGASPRTVRFDLGPSPCAAPAQNVDIESVALPRTEAAYEAGDTFALLRADLDAATAEQLGARVNYLAYVEGVGVGGVAGQADVPLDDTGGRTNSSNQGHLFAVIYDAFALAEGERRATFLHEMAHNLGAVQDSAPNSSKAGHCHDEDDIMCYDDDGAGVPSTVCDLNPATAFDEAFDCNGDDYWNPSPAGGSYLAGSWNTYDSDFLCASAQCDSAQSPPSVSLSVSGKQLRGEQVSFAATAPAGTLFDWDLDGDGVFEATTGTSASTATVYGANGTVTPRVRATAQNGSFAVAGTTLTINEPVLPNPDYTFSPASPLVGETVTFDASPTQDPDGIITSYSWDLNDDGTLDVNSQLVKVFQTAFTDVGARFVWLQVDYPLGFRAKAYSVNVVPPPAPPTVRTGVTAAASVAVAKVRLRALVARGLPLRFECGSACQLTAKLTIAKKLAKKLGLRSTRIGSVKKAVAAPGKATATLTLTRAAKRALRRQRRLAATLDIAIAKAGPPLTLKRKLTF